MISTFAALLAATFLLQADDAGAAPAKPDESLLQFRLGDGIRLNTGPLRARLRTRFHFDAASEDLGDVFPDGFEIGSEPFEEGFGLRRARWLLDAQFVETSPLAPLSVRAQLDFGQSEIRWLDLSADLALGSFLDASSSTWLRGGEFRETFGLEAMTSVTFLPFIERSIATNAFTPGRNRGVQWNARGEQYGLSVGHFSASRGEPFPDELGTERATTLHGFIEPEGTWLDQFGVGVSIRRPGDDGIQFSARPGTRLFEPVIDTGDIDADRATLVSLEALRVRGATMVLAEAFGARLSGVGGANFFGGHIAVTHFLNGGNVVRRSDDGGLKAPNVPDLLSSDTAGSGAVELALRTGWADLSDGPLSTGGRAFDVEAGVNWYFAPGTRLMLHGLFVRGDGGATGAALLSRIQLQL